MSRASLSATVLLLLSMSGCAFDRSYWSHHPPAAPPGEARELQITQDGAAAGFPQHWRQDTLVVDLQSVSGRGGITLWPKPGSPWPARLAFQVTPGSIGVLEVDGQLRSILPVTDGGKGPVELELDPDVYSRAKTTKIGVAWRPAEPVSP